MFEQLRFENKTINLFLVPHSHLDPGWIESIDVYYSKKVKSILNNIVDRLSSKQSKKDNEKFTWCETIYLKKWWMDESVAAK